MSHTPHELTEEFPHLQEKLHALKSSNAHFARLADSYHEINRQIHRMVIDIADNPVLTATWSSLLPRVERARALPNLDPNRWTAALLEHSKMFSALAARDGALLSRLCREHFLNGLPSPTRQSDESLPAAARKRRPRP